MAGPPASAVDGMQALIAAVRRGDQPAFERLMAEYTPPLRRIVEAGLDAHLRHVIDPEDVLQEVLITVYRKLPDLDFRGIAPFRKWLGTVADSRLIDLRRRHFCGKRHPDQLRSLEESIGNSPSGSELNVGDAVCSSSPSPSSVAARHETEGRLEAILAQLPAHYRAVIEQVLVQRLPIAAIAHDAGSTPEAVRKMLSRALRACRDLPAARGLCQHEGGPAA